MWTSENIKTAVTGGRSQYQSLKDYLLKKDLYFIVSGGELRNSPGQHLDEKALGRLLDEFARCRATMINWNGSQPSPPFLGADLDPGTRTARVSFLVDLTREAESGEASPFYSKIMGALATQFFAAQQDMDRLWFPFMLKDTVGRGVALEPGDKGMFLRRK